MSTLVSILDLPTIDRRATVDKLQLNGWREAPVESADPTFVHPEVKGEQDARDRLRGIGLDPQDFYIEDDTDAHWSP
jgi:hypothetical protein